MKKHRVISLEVGLFFFFSCLVSCKRIPKDDLVGTWKHDFLGSPYRTAPQYLELRFECNKKFYLKMESYSEILWHDTCYMGAYTEYIKGKYTRRAGRLILEGTYLHSDYATPVTGGCYNTGKFRQAYKVLEIDNQDMKLERIKKDKDEETATDIRLKKIKTNTCD